MGALTLKSFSDELREWEFIESEGIDPTDSFGVNLRLSVREDQIFLAEPIDPQVPWLTDRGRLFFDGMFEEPSTIRIPQWESFFNELNETFYFTDHLNFHKKSISSFIFVFENVSLETLSMLYLLEQQCSLVKLRKAEKYQLNNDIETNYQLNNSVQKSRLALSTLGVLINTDTRHEGYVLNLNLRQRFLKGNFKLITIGSTLDLTFPTYNIGSSMGIVNSIAEGTHLICQDFSNSEFPVLIANTESFRRSDSKHIVKLLKHAVVVNSAWNGFNVLNSSISSVGVNSLSFFLPISSEDLVNFFGLYFINVSLDAVANIKQLIELQLLRLLSSKMKSKKSLFVDQNNKDLNINVYHKLKLTSSVCKNYYHLPNNLFLEDNETYVNTQGLIKRTAKVINFKKEAKTNWQILRKFYSKSKKSNFLSNKKDHNLLSFDCVNVFNYKTYVHFQFQAAQTLTSMAYYLNKQNKPFSISELFSVKAPKIKVINTKMKSWLDDFFNGSGKDFYSYNSSSLVNCSKISRVSSTNFF